MADLGADALKALVPIATAILGGTAGYFVKIWEIRYQERRTEASAWLKQKQTRWSPFLKSARELQARLEFLRGVYKRAPGMSFSPESLSADFRELYALSRAEIPNFQECDPDAPRRNPVEVQRLRSRMCHELTFAESSVYITAVYLGRSEYVWRDLNQDVLTVPDEARKDMLRLVDDVRQSLQGKSGAGIFAEQQEYIGEAMWTPGDGVLSNLEFRNRILDLPGWESFKNLIRFYADFGPKIEHEVKDTVAALGALVDRIDELRRSKDPRSYELQRHRASNGRRRLS
jgi:hypothetical protein